MLLPLYMSSDQKIKDSSGRTVVIDYGIPADHEHDNRRSNPRLRCSRTRLSGNVKRSRLTTKHV